eukprot:15091759-Alexandrium_andersonii.AAC.1
MSSWRQAVGWDLSGWTLLSRAPQAVAGGPPCVLFVPRPRICAWTELRIALATACLLYTSPSPRD